MHLRCGGKPQSEVLLKQMLYKVMISFKISSQPTHTRIVLYISNGLFYGFHQMWFKVKCPQCARLQKEFPSFQYMSDLLFTEPKLIKGGYDPY